MFIYVFIGAYLLLSLAIILSVREMNKRISEVESLSYQRSDRVWDKIVRMEREREIEKNARDAILEHLKPKASVITLPVPKPRQKPKTRVNNKRLIKKLKSQLKELS